MLANRGSEVSLEQVPRMEQPREARLRRMAWPIPRVAPVMMAIFPERSWGRGWIVGDILGVDWAGKWGRESGMESGWDGWYWWSDTDRS